MRLYTVYAKHLPNEDSHTVWTIEAPSANEAREIIAEAFNRQDWSRVVDRDEFDAYPIERRTEDSE